MTKVNVGCGTRIEIIDVWISDVSEFWKDNTTEKKEH